MNCTLDTARYQVYTYMGGMNLQDMNTVDEGTNLPAIAGLQKDRISNGLPNFRSKWKDSTPLSLKEKKQVLQQMLQMCERMMRKPALVHTDIWAAKIIVRQREAQDDIQVGLVDYGSVVDCTDSLACSTSYFLNPKFQITAASDMLRFANWQIFIPLFVQDPWTAFAKKISDSGQGVLTTADWTEDNLRSFMMYRISRFMLLAMSASPQGIASTLCCSGDRCIICAEKNDLRDSNAALSRNTKKLVDRFIADPMDVRFFGTFVGPEHPKANMTLGEEIEELGMDFDALLAEALGKLTAPAGFWSFLKEFLVITEMGIGTLPTEAGALEALIEEQRLAIERLTSSDFFKQ